MKTKNIFKTLVLAAVLVSACSKNEIDNDFKGYTLPVTINVTRQGDAATRATYDGESKKLSFSTGDKLFVQGSDSKAGEYAGLLAWQSEGTFSGTIMTENEYDGTAEELLSSATDGAEALLIPAGYKSYEYFELDDIAPDASYYQNKTNAFALTKAAAVEQFSFELAETYSSGFTLSSQNAIVSFTISGLTANKDVAVSFNPINYVVISKNVTTSAEGVATFAIGLDAGTQLGTLTVDGKNIAMPTATTVAGHIYNISRNVKVVIWNSSKVAGISINEDPEENSFESDGITVAAFGDSGANFKNSKMSVGGWDGYFTFTSSVGNIKKIEINYTGDVDGYEEETPVGWSLDDGTFTWSGTPATSVTLSSFGYAGIEGITSIVFTLE
jgi:hypothetical protein